MNRAAVAMLAAGAAHAERVRAATLEAFEVFGDERMVVPVMLASVEVARRLNVSWSRGLEREVIAALAGPGARLYSVADRRLLRGVRWRGQSVRDAVEASIEHKRWARNRGGRPGQGADAQEDEEARGAAASPESASARRPAGR